MKASVIVLSAGVVGLVALMLYLSKKNTATVSTTGGLPINSLPGRAYAMNYFNPSGQPPAATFSPFSGVPFVESLLGGFSAPSVSPVVGSNDGYNPPDLSAGAIAATAPFFAGSGGLGAGGSGTDTGGLSSYDFASG